MATNICTSPLLGGASLANCPLYDCSEASKSISGADAKKSEFHCQVKAEALLILLLSILDECVIWPFVTCMKSIMK